MKTFDLDAYVSRSRALDVSDLPWAEVGRYSLPAEAVRTLCYMQRIESHTTGDCVRSLGTRC
jgi:hypothetical protein